MSKKSFNFLRSTFKSLDFFKKFITKDLENFVTNGNSHFYSNPLSLVNKNLAPLPIQNSNLIAEFGKLYIEESNNHNLFKTGNVFSLNKFLSKSNLNQELTQLTKRSFSTDSNPQKPMETKKMIATGGDFRDVVTKSSIFVDKSLFIKEVIEDSAKTILIAMPRRWGKTLNLDMLKRFLSIEVDEKGQVIPNNETDNYKLFTGGKINITSGFKNIDKELTELKLIKQIPEAVSIQGQFPVIKMDFKDCKGVSFEDVKSKLKYAIVKTINQFSYLGNSIQAYENTTIAKSYNNLLDTASSNNFTSAIKELSSLLYVYHGKKVWILIDEYDAAANQAYLEFNAKEAKQVSELFRGVFEPALKGNDFLEKGILTGVQYIVKSGMLSGLNNISKYNITSAKYSKYYGINEEEMNPLLAHFNIEEIHARRIKDWYNGYKENVGRVEDQQLIDKYNIWSVVNYLNRQDEGFKSYWEDSKLGQIINKEILRNPEIKKQIERLINNDNLILDKLISDFSIDNFKELKEMTDNPGGKEISQNGVELLFSYLFITGYLTITSKKNEYTLPNKEIKTEFETKIKEYYKTIFNIDPVKFSNLTKIIDKIFYTSSSQKINLILKNDFAPSLEELIKSVKLYKEAGINEDTKGLFANEDLMHSLLNNIVLQVVNSNFATERYTTKTDGKKGRADIVIEKNNTGVVVGVGCDGDAKEALCQSKEYNKLIETCETKVFVGCNISAEQDITLSGDIVTAESIVHFEYP